MSIKSRICIIVLYFGELPAWFQLWLNSCSENQNIDWILFTDDSQEYLYPNNVKRYETSFADIKEKIKSRFDFKINISTPYKLCDYKVAYGYIFKDYIKEYTHWGYCDVDMIFGKLEDFLDDDILNNYDRIFNKGHLTIYKNNKRVNEYFKLKYSGINYREIFSSPYHYGFDETAGMDKIYMEYNLSQYIPEIPIISDINFSFYDFRINGKENYKNQVFVYKNNKIMRYYIKDNQELIDTYAYIHFQKRNLRVNNNSNNEYIISNEGFYDLKDNIYTYNRRNLLKNIQYKNIYLKYLIKQKFIRLIRWKLRVK